MARSFLPLEEDWHGSGCIRFMLASNVVLLVRVVVADSLATACGYARLRLGRVGEGEFTLTGEVKESEYVTVQDKLLGHVTVNFTVRSNDGCHCHAMWTFESKTAGQPKKSTYVEVGVIVLALPLGEKVVIGPHKISLRCIY